MKPFKRIYITCFVRKLTPKRLLYFGIFILIIIGIYVFNIGDDGLPPFPLHSPLLKDISCYSKKSELPLVNMDFMPSVRSIFFHVVSCKNGLNAREACSVEAVARSHPLWQIHVLFTGAVQKYQGPMKSLEVFNNVHFSRINFIDYIKGTALEQNLQSFNDLKRSRWPVADVEDLIRFTTLYKYGGIYLDLDTIVVKPLSSLKGNWAVRLNNNTMAVGMVALSRDELGRTVAKKVMQELAKLPLRTSIWGYNNVNPLKKVLKEMCASSEMYEMQASKCAGFEVYNRNQFYPVGYRRSIEYYFTPGELNNQDVYSHYLWSSVTHAISIRKDSRLAEIARKYCPTVDKYHNEEFGGTL